MYLGQSHSNLSINTSEGKYIYIYICIYNMLLKSLGPVTEGFDQDNIS